MSVGVAVAVALLAVHEVLRFFKVGSGSSVLPLLVEHQSTGIGGVGGRGGSAAQALKGLGSFGILPGGKQIHRFIVGFGPVLCAAGEQKRAHQQHRKSERKMAYSSTST